MKKDEPAACRIKVTLRDVSPPVWRRIEIGTSITFEDLHHILQTAMGWTDSHLPSRRCSSRSRGPWGYAENLAALGDADRSDHEDMVDWFLPGSILRRSTSTP